MNCVIMKWLLLPSLLYVGFGLLQHLEGIVNEDTCDTLGGPGTYDKVKVASEISKICIYELFDIDTSMDTLESELYEEKTTGTLDEVAPKYEISIKNVNDCLKNYMEIVKLCLTKEEEKNVITFEEKLSKDLNRIYEHGGQGIFEIRDDGGIECVKSRIRGITKCYMENLPCNDFEKFKNCTLEESRDNCPSSLSANITKELLQFVNSSICMDDKIIRSRRSSRRIVRDVGGMETHLPQIQFAVVVQCTRHGASEEQLNGTLDKMYDCLKEKRIFITPKKEYLDHMDNCTKDAVKTFTACLPERLKYLPKFLFNLTHSLVRVLYDDFDDIAYGLGPCLNKLKSHESEIKYHACVKKAGGEDADEIPTTKTKFCQKFLPLSKCFTTQINDTCEHNARLDKFSKDYIAALEEPCQITF